MADDTKSMPPENPFESGGGGEPDGGLESQAPAVAAAPGKLFLYLFLGVTAAFIVINYIILGGGGDDKDKGTREPLQPVAGGVEAPPPPPPPDVIPPPKPFTELPPPTPVTDIGTTVEPGPSDKERLERLRSGIMVFEGGKGVLGGLGGGGGAAEEEDAGAQFASTDPNLAFANKATRATKAEKAKAGNLGDLRSTIGQGKLIHAVLETAINTQLPGQVRAIVSRDIYAEAGKARLIPKGSRLVGVYNTDIFRGQERVFIVWTRVIRPDGVDMFVASPGVDQLGRGGLAGAVDTKFNEIFTSAILTSVISIGVAWAAEGITGGDDVSSTTNTDGSTTTTGDATSRATAAAVGNLGAVSRRYLNNIIDTRPTISIDQGTKVNVMVNRDLIFQGATPEISKFVE